MQSIPPVNEAPQPELFPKVNEKTPPSALRAKLKNGLPADKESMLNYFRDYPVLELVPDVIEATLDDTSSNRHRDAGSSKIYNLAATALCKFALTLQERTEAECRSSEFTFFETTGTGDLARRRNVHDAWKRWWDAYSTGIRRAATLPVVHPE